jgi:glucose-6-phosphate isomerase
MPQGVKLTFFDTAHVRLLKEANSRMRKIYRDKGEVLINFISKSGSTNETVMNARVLIDNLRDITDKWRDHVVVTTEPDSKLDDWARNQGIASLPNPKHVGGRYSVMSAVGIFPLALAGVDIKKLHKGASRILERCLLVDARKNPALQSVAAVYSAMKNKSNIHNLFVFNMDLEGMGKWYRQLVGESLGKDGKGITPMVSVGSTDLHSMLQMFLGGPNDKFTTFVRVKPSQDIHIASIDEQLDSIVPQLNQKSITQVMEAIYEGTTGSYQKRKLPFVEVILDKLNEEELGAFLQFKMIETMLLGKLMGVNAFDQPNVEEYKKITRRLLEE